MVNEVDFIHYFKIKTGLLTGIKLSESDPSIIFKSVFIRDNEENDVDKLVLYQIITDSVLYDIGTNLDLAKGIANTYEGLSSDEINEKCNGRSINEIGLPIEVKHYVEIYEDRQYFKNNPEMNLIKQYLKNLEEILPSKSTESSKIILESIKKQLLNFKGVNTLQLFTEDYKTLFYFFEHYNLTVEALVEKLEEDLLELIEAEGVVN